MRKNKRMRPTVTEKAPHWNFPILHKLFSFTITEPSKDLIVKIRSSHSTPYLSLCLLLLCVCVCVCNRNDANAVYRSLSSRYDFSTHSRYGFIHSSLLSPTHKLMIKSEEPPNLFFSHAMTFSSVLFKGGHN